MIENEVYATDVILEDVDSSAVETSLDISNEGTAELVDTMPITDASMEIDGTMGSEDTLDSEGQGLSNTAILSIVIGVCVVLGIVLGIIFGKRAANK